MRAALVAAVLVALAATGALADHVYSHRVVVEGRLIGADGAPIVGRDVNVSWVGDDFSQACDEQRNVTDAWGDFWFCYHKHAVADGVVFTVRAGVDVADERPLDYDLRRIVFLLRDANATGTAPERWNTTFLVAGRVWNAGRVNLDDVVVNGVAASREPVNITLTTPGRNVTNVTFTDGYGDYESVLRLQPGEDPREVDVTARTRRGAFDTRLDPDFHRTVLDILSPQFVPAPPTGHRDTSGDAPGSATPPLTVSMVALVAAGIVASLAWAMWRAKD